MHLTAAAKALKRSMRELLATLEKKRGLLIAFEGPDGAGKTTQRKLFKTWLKGEGHKVVTSKWNSSELLKSLIKTRKTIHALNPREFCLLHAADYRHRLETEILPALCSGQNVICDRYFFTALARDAARGLDVDWVLKLYTPLLWPDVVFYFSVSAETSSKRVMAERTPHFYEAGQDTTNIEDPQASYRQFMGRIIQQYGALALVFQFVTIDAEMSIYEQHKMIRKLFLEGRRRSWTEFNAESVMDWLATRPEVQLAQE
ncbi:MAG: dTMP kinase [Bryobacteraceae bacterium]|nr:dTMP kinase [Bryobacteraceae bacterium]